MKKITVFLADGFEEVEALTTVDLLRRAGGDVTTMSINKLDYVIGSHNISVKCDSIINKDIIYNSDMLILPGGMPGTKNLNNSDIVREAIIKFNNEGRLLGAICAAPMVFGGLGILNGKKACIYPSMEEYLKGAIVEDGLVSVDGNIITSRGVGTAIAFSLVIIEKLFSKEVSDKIKNEIVYKF